MSQDLLANRKTPRAVAAYWLNRRRSGEMSQDDIRAFRVWLQRDPGNKSAYEKAERVWTVLGAVVDDPAVMSSRERNLRTLDDSTRMKWVGGIAACLAIATVGGWAVATTIKFDELSLFAPKVAQELRTEVGQRATVTLRDHSVVTLDTNTVVRLRESAWERRIELVSGRAYFQVAKDKSRPFIVSAGGGKTVRATGTAFDVRVEANRFEVTLVEGRVRVQGPGDSDEQKAEMRAGWRLAVGQDKQWRIAPVDVNKETSWRNGRLTFFLDPLPDAVAEMNRYSTKKIVLAEDIPDAIVGGVFEAGDVDDFVIAIEMNKLARVKSRTKDRIELVAR